MTLHAEHLAKSFTSPAKVILFEDLSLTVEKGQSVAITGRSGEGKTTLLHILGGLEAPDTGDVWIAGVKVSASNANRVRRRHLGFVFQSSNLLEDFTALENVLMPARILREDVRQEWGMFLLNEVGLSQRTNFPVKLLSGGERQRVAIARALCNNPDLILADEPSGNLDGKNASQIKDLLLTLVKRQSKSLILVTHDMDLAASCDVRYFLDQGKLNQKLLA